MKITVDVWQRVMLSKIVGGAKGNFASIHKAMKALDILQMTPDEQLQVGFQVTPEGDMSWEDTKRTFELEFDDSDIFRFVKRLATQYQGWVGFDARLAIQLEELLENAT